jgi:hypothetical protein
MSRLRRIAGVSAVAFTLSAGASGAEPLARTAAPFEAQHVSLDAWGGVTAFSQFDPATYEYRLAVIRGGAPELLPLAPQPAPFDLDVGPGPDGKPTLVYARCPVATGTPVANGCDLYRYSFATATEAPIAGANTASEETAPSVWKDELVFARTRPYAAVARVYRRPLDRPGARSTRLALIPRERCRAGACRRTDYGTVDETELRGSRLAVVVRVGPGRYDAPDVQVRLLDHGRATLVANAAVGAISVRKQFLGLSFEAGTLSFARSFYYSSPDRVFRYRIARGRYSSAALARTTYGLAAAGGGYLRLGTCIPGCTTIPPPPGSTLFAPGPFPLDLTAIGAPRFTRASPPR